VTTPGSGYGYDRIPYLVMFEDKSDFRDTYGGVGEQVALECYLLRPARPRSAAAPTCR